MYIAVDFDGTCVTDDWPHVGIEAPFCIEMLKRFKADGHKVILLTCREGELLTEAITWLTWRGFIPDYINDNPEARAKWGDCRKVYADMYIDDKNAFIKKRDDGAVDWLWIKRQYEKIDEKDNIVSSPSHYKSRGVEAIDVLESLEPCGHVWNALKYLMRAGKKEGEPEIKDLKKAVWYLKRRIENLQNEREHE